MVGQRKNSWLKLWFPALNDKVRWLAIYLNQKNIPMAYTSEETVEVLQKAHEALVSGKETTAAALASERAALARAEEALALVEPLKESNSALQTLAANLEDQVNASKVRLAEWEAQDAAEDAALEPLAAFLTPTVPPTEPPVEDGPPSLDPPVTPPDEPVVEEDAGDTDLDANDGDERP